MKTLPMKRDQSGQKVTVACADKEVSVYSHCAYCKHCEGVQIRKRVIPTPQKDKISGISKGTSEDDDLLNSQMMFNTLIRDGDSIVCSDDENQGYTSMYSY